MSKNLTMRFNQYHFIHKYRNYIMNEKKFICYICKVEIILCHRVVTMDVEYYAQYTRLTLFYHGLVSL